MKNLHSWNYFYTTAGRDSRDKFQVWLGIIPKKYHFFQCFPHLNSLVQLLRHPQRYESGAYSQIIISILLYNFIPNLDNSVSQMRSLRERGKARKYKILALAPERGKICDGGWETDQYHIKTQSFCFRSFHCQLNRYVVEPAGESLMAFANCRQRKQHHSQASSLLSGSQ